MYILELTHWEWYGENRTSAIAVSDSIEKLQALAIKNPAIYDEQWRLTQARGITTMKLEFNIDYCKIDTDDIIACSIYTINEIQTL